jgi:hypothetical protein
MRQAALELDLGTEEILQAAKAGTGQPENIVRSWFNPQADMYFSAEEAVKA